MQIPVAFVTALLLSSISLAAQGVAVEPDPNPAPQVRALDIRLADALDASLLYRGDTFEGILEDTAGDDFPIPVRGRVLDAVTGEGDFDHLTLTLSEVYYEGEWRPLETETLKLQRERRNGRSWLSSALSLGAVVGEGGSSCPRRRGSAVGAGASLGLAGLALLLQDRGRLELAEGDVLSFVLADRRP